MSSDDPKPLLALMDKIDTVRGQTAALSADDLAARAVSIYKQQGVDVDPSLASALAKAMLEPSLPLRLPPLPDPTRAQRDKWTRWSMLSMCVSVFSFFFQLAPWWVCGLGLLASSAVMMLKVAPQIVEKEIYADKARPQLYRLLLRSATNEQIDDLLHNPQAQEEVLVLARHEEFLRRSLVK